MYSIYIYIYKVPPVQALRLSHPHLPPFGILLTGAHSCIAGRHTELDGAINGETPRVKSNRYGKTMGNSRKML